MRSTMLSIIDLQIEIATCLFRTPVFYNIQLDQVFQCPLNSYDTFVKFISHSNCADTRRRDDTIIYQLFCIIYRIVYRIILVTR